MSPLGHKRPAQQGSTLIEVLVAMVLFSVGVVGLLRTLTLTVRDVGEVELRSLAMSAAEGRLAQIWTDLPNAASYVESNTALADLPQGKRSVVISDALVTVSVSWQAPTGDAHTYSTNATLPAAPASTPPLTPTPAP